MKTVKQLQQEIKELTQELRPPLTQTGDISASQKRKIKKRIEYLNQLILFLKTDPTQESVLSQKEKLRKLINGINQGWKRYCIPGSPKDEKKRKREYYKMHSMTKLRQQYQTLNYLLHEQNN